MSSFDPTSQQLSSHLGEADRRQHYLSALRRLLKMAQRDTGQCRFVARFLLGLYNGYRFPFDLTSFRCLDVDVYEDCMTVLRMDASHLACEVHEYFPDGNALFESLVTKWGVENIAMLKGAAIDIIRLERRPYASEEKRAEVVSTLKQSIFYCEERRDF